MQKFDITGMSCAACSARVEKAVSGLEGVRECSVNLLTNSMTVEGSASAEEIITAVTSAGYGAAAAEGSKKPREKSDSAAEKTVLKRFVASIIFLIGLMYLSMGHSMLGLPLAGGFSENFIAQGIAQSIISGLILVINQKYFISGFKSLVNRAPNMDALVAIGSAASYIYSLFNLFAMTFAEPAAQQHYLHGLYFESAAMILTLITLGKLLEAHSKGKTTSALNALMELAPKTANVIREGRELTIPAEKLRVGDVFTVRPGEDIPADGIVLEGGGAVDESSLTGESVPIDKKIGDSVFTATVNQSGFLKCEAVKTGEDTVLSGIIKAVSDAAASKAPIAKAADKISGIFVPAVMVISAVTFIIWILLDSGTATALTHAVAVLVVSCPCALGLATPVAIMVGSGVAAKNGILFKTASALESAGKTDIIVLDKTGTITKGSPMVTDIISISSDEASLLSLAAAVEAKSEHPLSVAVLSAASERGLEIAEVADFKALAGMGVSAALGGEMLAGGNAEYISTLCEIPDSIKEKLRSLSEMGKTPLCFSLGGSFLGVIAVSDTEKPESPHAIAELKKAGLRVVMLTGDNRSTAKAIAERVGIDEVIADVLPSGKERAIAELKAEGRVAMVGDGINDAPALTRADTGMAIGAGTDIAIDAADVVLMKSSLADVPAAIRLSRAVLRNIHQNLFWAFCYNIIGIPLAAGAFSAFGLNLTPMFGAAAMSFSSFFVVTNALRLNFIKLYRQKEKKAPSSDKTNQKKEKREMEKVIKIEGMMCHHCEAHVKKALEAIEGICEATPDYTSGSVALKLTAEVSNEAIKAAVEAEGYKLS